MGFSYSLGVWLRSFEQVHHARVPGCCALCWSLGIHERCLPRPRSSVRIILSPRPNLWVLRSLTKDSFGVSGAKLRIVNSAVALGTRIMTARSEAR
jgi:hypothetical protein